MKKLLCVMGLLSASVLSFNIVAETTEIGKKELKIGTECTYFPYTYKDAEGNIEGFDVDLAREVAKRINREAVFVCNPFASSIPSLNSKKFDVLFSALSVTEERLKSVNFSIPYRSSTGRFVGASTLAVEPFDGEGKPNSQALKGKTVGLQRSSMYDKYIKEMFPDVKLRRYDTVDNMMLDLKSQRLDIVFAGTIMASDFLKKEGEQFKFIGSEVDRPDYFGAGNAAALRKGDDELTQQVNDALTAIYADGTFKAINLKYWTFSVLPSVWQ